MAVVFLILALRLRGLAVPLVLIATVVLPFAAALGASGVFFNATGAVITSAGCVLAATFAVLGTLPPTTLTGVGLMVAFGILAGTVIVQSVRVTALNLDIGHWMRWPAKLAHHPIRHQPNSAKNAPG